MHLQNQRRLAANRAAVILERCFVGRAYLAQPRSAGFENVGNPKAAADLDEFAARDNDFVFPRRRFTRSCAPGAFGNRRICLAEVPQDQDERGGIVVDDGGSLGLAKRRETSLQIRCATASRAAGKSIFEIAVTRSDV